MSNSSRLLQLTMCVALTGSAPAFAQPVEHNRLKNPGAEEVSKEDAALPSAWFAARAAAEGLTMNLDDKIVRAGRRSLFVGNTHIYPAATFNNWAQRVEGLKPGEAYVLSAWIKADRAEQASICVQVWDEGAKNMVAFSTSETIVGTREWQKIESEPITIPASASAVIVRAGLGGRGKVWFDELSLRPADMPALPQPPQEAGANLVVNPGAEEVDEKLKDEAFSWFKAHVAAPGLEMRRVTEGARQGRAALLIANTHQYGQAVSNNWAQTVPYELAGRVVRVSGWVKTEEAEHVNICVQGWADLVNMPSYASTEVVKGTQDWKRMTSKPVRLSPGVTMVTVRAVLTGTGKAWFDDITLELADEEPVE